MNASIRHLTRPLCGLAALLLLSQPLMLLQPALADSTTSTDTTTPPAATTEQPISAQPSAAQPAAAQPTTAQPADAQAAPAPAAAVQQQAPVQQASATPPAPMTYISPSYFNADETAGKLPPVAQRLPEHPAIASMAEPGRQGGEIRMLMASGKDVRVLVAYSYARLVSYNSNYQLQADILESYEAVDNKVFTFHLRKGMKWSDGEPFTTEDFRYFWEDVANNSDLNPGGVPTQLLVNGKPPKVEILDPTTIRYSWDEPNAEFLPALASASPLFIFRPAHYLKKYHVKYAKKDKLEALVKKSGQRNWASLHNKKDNQYKNDNPDLPTLDPWISRVKPPAQRFVFTRNPYYYRVDAAGHQLPYADQIVFDIADSKLIAAKTASGESDLQARYISFNDYTILKDGEAMGHYHVRLWDDGRGSTMALFPNLTTTDPIWRQMMRDMRFRHALSLGIDRHEINQAIYFGLGQEGANTVLSHSPMYSPEIAKMWSAFDPDQANALLDQMGLTQRDENGIRLLPDGRPAQIIVDAAGEDPQEDDVLELVGESWKQIGISLYVKPSQREVFRDRIFTGDSVMSISNGIDNSFPTPDMSPAEFAPSTQQQYMWAKWGQYIETAGKSGEKVDLPAARQLADWLEAWRMSPDPNQRLNLWFQILHLWADQVFTIGIVANVPQPVVVSDHLHNVPQKAIFAWDPGAHLGIYKPDTFWVDDDRPLSTVPGKDDN